MCGEGRVVRGQGSARQGSVRCGLVRGEAQSVSSCVPGRPLRVSVRVRVRVGVRVRVWVRVRVRAALAAAKRCSSAAAFCAASRAWLALG